MLICPFNIRSHNQGLADTFLQKIFLLLYLQQNCQILLSATARMYIQVHQLFQLFCLYNNFFQSIQKFSSLIKPTGKPRRNISRLKNQCRIKKQYRMQVVRIKHQTSAVFPGSISVDLKFQKTLLSLTDLQEINVYVAPTEEKMIICYFQTSQNVTVICCVHQLQDGASSAASAKDCYISALKLYSLLCLKEDVLGYACDILKTSAMVAVKRLSFSSSFQSTLFQINTKPHRMKF